MLQKKSICTHLRLCVLLTRHRSAALSLLILGTPSMSTNYCSVLRTGFLLKATPSSMARNRQILTQDYGSVFSCQENVKGNIEGCKQLPTNCCFFIQLVGGKKSSFLCFVTHRNTDNLNALLMFIQTKTLQEQASY